jgi:hypothetical protein
MARSLFSYLALALLPLALHVNAQNGVTVYYPKNTQVIFGPNTNSSAASSTATSGAAAYTGAAAYNPTRLTPPPVPSPAINTQFPITLLQGGMANMSIKQNGNFMGFSIEMSVVNQLSESLRLSCMYQLLMLVYHQSAETGSSR